MENKLDLSNEKDLLKIKKGQTLPEFIFDGKLYPPGGVVTKVDDEGVGTRGKMIEYNIQFPDAKYRIYWSVAEKIFSIGSL